VILVSKNGNNQTINQQFAIFDVDVLEIKEEEGIQQASGLSDKFKQMQQWIAKENKVDVNKVQTQMIDFISKIQSVLSNCPIEQQGFKMETVEVNAQISAEGQIGFMGTHVGMTGTGGIKFVFKRI
jgi:hypothetical protein